MKKLLSGAAVLAPMVRCGTLPLRLAVLRHGATFAWGEELVDHKVMHGRKAKNDLLGTTDYYDKNNICFFRTCEEERGRVIFQLGSGSAATAVAAARVIADDVFGIDINMGCPLPFSVQGGMGSALLGKPDTVREILSALKKEFPHLSISAKIRLLETPEKTIALARVIEEAGADFLTVHCRFVKERPHQPCHWDLLPAVIASVGIPVLVNGSIFDRDDIPRALSATGAAGVMIARGALYNPAIFTPLPTPLPPHEAAIRELLEMSMRYDNPWGWTKYTLQHCYERVPGAKNMRDGITRAADWLPLCELLGVDLARAKDLLAFTTKRTEKQAKNQSTAQKRKERPPEQDEDFDVDE